MTGNNLRQRLIFGTGRLAGGAYAPTSRRMIETCLRAGIHTFDTAPVYGMGAAESLLGDVIAGADGIAIHTKVGSQAPSLPGLRGWAKRVRNLAPNAGAQDRVDSAPARYAGPSASMDYSRDYVTASLEQSRRRLRRDRLDLVLLHEAEPQDIPEGTWAALQAQAGSSRIAQLGFAHSGPPQHKSAQLVAQTAPWPDDFLAPSGPNPRVFHSVLRGLNAAINANPAVAAAAAETSARHGLDREGAAGTYAAGLLLLAQTWPDAKLIFATTAPDRLNTFLALLDRIETTA